MPNPKKTSFNKIALFTLVSLAVGLSGGFYLGSVRMDSSSVKTELPANEKHVGFEFQAFKPNYQLYLNQAVGLSLEYPTTFMMSAHKGEYGGSYFFTLEKKQARDPNPKVSGIDGHYGNNELRMDISMSKAEVTTLDELLTKVKKRMEREELKLISETPVTISGVPAVTLVTEVSGSRAGYDQSTIFVHNGYEIQIGKIPYTTTLNKEYEQLVNSIQLTDYAE